MQTNTRETRSLRRADRSEQAQAPRPLAARIDLGGVAAEGARIVGNAQLARALAGEADDELAGLHAARLALAVAGVSLPADDLQRMERAFGKELDHVRIHADARAAAAADALGAHAFAIGPDLFFASGAFAPGTREGDRLLAHELTHVVQHDGGRLSGDRGVSSPSDPSEQEAYANEDRILTALDAPTPDAPPEPEASPSAPAPDAPALRSVVPGAPEELIAGLEGAGETDADELLAARDATLPHAAELADAFGVDLGGLDTVLGGPEAETRCDELDAEAVTEGSTITFRDAHPSLEVVAHEIAHAVQQSPSLLTEHRRATEEDATEQSTPDAEREAQAAAAAVVAGERPVVRTAASVGPACVNEAYNATAEGGSWSDPEGDASTGRLPWHGTDRWDDEEILTHLTQIDDSAETQEDPVSCGGFAALAAFVRQGPAAVASHAGGLQVQLDSRRGDGLGATQDGRARTLLANLPARFTDGTATYADLRALAEAMYLIANGDGQPGTTMDEGAQLGDMSTVEREADPDLSRLPPGRSCGTPEVASLLAGLRRHPGLTASLGVLMTNPVSDGYNALHAVTLGVDDQGTWIYDPWPREGRQVVRDAHELQTYTGTFRILSYVRGGGVPGPS